MSKFMRLDDLFIISLRQVMRQHRRTIGVALAIALGTAGLIVVITMGEDVKRNINRDLDLLGGATRIKVYFEGRADNPLVSKPQWFRKHTVEAIKKIPNVVGVAPMIGKIGYRGSLMHWRDRPYHFRVVGVDEKFWTVNDFSAQKGTLFSRRAVTDGARVCVLGATMAKTVFGDTDPTGEWITIDQELFRIIGVLGGVGTGDRIKWVFIPISTAESRLPQADVLRIMYVRCRTWDHVKPVAANIRRVIEASQPSDNLVVEVAWDRLNMVIKTSWWIVVFIYLSGAATLLLGGFGIWNVMMIAVRARTREIGLKKAMGAKDLDILSQFLTEAIFLSMASALLGVVIGRVAIEILAQTMGTTPPDDVFLICVLSGLLFSLIIGVVAGLAPSIKASRMEVVSAVRFE